MKLHVLIMLGLVSAAGHAEMKTQLMTPQRYTELCRVDYLYKRAADKKAVEFYNKSKWAIVPAGMSAEEVEAKFAVNSLRDLKFVRVQPSAENDAELNDDETMVYTAASVVYVNKAGTEVHVRVQRSKPLIARQISTSSAYGDFFSEMSQSTDAKKLEAIDAFQMVEVPLNQNNPEVFCDLVAVGGATDFRSK